MKAFLASIFQSIIATLVYEVGKTAVSTAAISSSVQERYMAAFESAICKFYADPKYAGNESRKHFDEYVKMLQDESLQEDILSSSSQIYPKMYELFVQEVSKDKILLGYTAVNAIFTSHKKLEQIKNSIQEAINVAQENRTEEKKEHESIQHSIDGLKGLITNPQMHDITLVPLDGSAVIQSGQDSHIVSRRQLIDRCVSALDAGRLVILYGAVKVGKNTLAQLVKKEKAENVEIHNIAKQNLQSEVLKYLSTENKVKIIITTTSALNKNFCNFDFSLIEQIEVPLLNISETEALIDTYNPTADLHTFIYGHTSGHPVLVKTLCSYFSTCGWIVNDGNFNQILNYSFDYDLTRALSDLISAIITEDETRILLNRLLLVNGAFTETIASMLADVAPQIGEPKRRLYSLIPTWVSETNGLFKISPLLNKLWHADISEECQKQCYRKLANNILGSKRLKESEVLNYVNYSVRAGDYDNAGSMYMTVLSKLHDIKYKLSRESIFRNLWIDVSLPNGMSSKIKMGVRIYQMLLLNNLTKKNYRYLLWDLKQLVENYEDDGQKAFFYITISLLCWKDNDVSDCLKYYNAYNLLDKTGTEAIMEQMGEKLSLFDHNIWIFLLSLKSIEEFENWLETFANANITYSVGDREICKFCYLSVLRLIGHYMADSALEVKINTLERIKDKAEQCKCQEIAIVCLFKSLELLAAAGKLEDAQYKYDSAYEKYSVNPLAVLLLNAAMAFANYKARKQDDNCLHYFDQVLEFQDKDLIPDVQLHIKEIYAYMVAEKDPRQSIDVLTDALEYVSDENHRFDIIEYYQCKGELSYAYWCIGEKSKSVELLSECVDFVLPLAGAEKDFAKTYLCLCNCLITKYCCDVQSKPLPQNQASPVRGMFTESDLVFLDDLYSKDRLYVTCYQMSDLCAQLEYNDLAYKWAKKFVAICRESEEVKESDYMLFLLTPIFRADEDFYDLSFIIRRSDQARRLAYQLHPELKTGNKDQEFIEYHFIPLLMAALIVKLKGNGREIELVKDIIRDYSAISDEVGVGLIKSIFERERYDNSFIDEIKKLNIQQHYGAYLCAYIMTAMDADNDYAFDLLMAIMPDLQKHLVQIYGLRIRSTINQFVSVFWKNRIFKNPEGFVGYDELKDKGLKKINEYRDKINLANKTMMVVSYHLKGVHKLNTIQEDWLDS